MWTNIPTADAVRHGFRQGRRCRAEISHLGKRLFSGDVPFVRAFGDVPAHAALLYNNELNRLALALNRGSFAERFGVGYGNEYKVVLSEET